MRAPMPTRSHRAFRSWAARVLAAVLATVPLSAFAAPAAPGGPAAGEPARAHAGEIRFPVALGSYSTTLHGSQPARTHNIRLAAAALDGAVLRPGEVLSFDRRVGARTSERGYQRAPVFLRGARDLQVGGGICQVASTVYAAAMLSALGPAERHKHTFVVGYIPLAHDATGSWGRKDLRVRNDLDQAVRLRVEVLGTTLTARFEGEAELGESLELEAVEREAPGGGAEAAGREVELYRVRRQGGLEVGRELLHVDVYPPAVGARPPRP